MFYPTREPWVGRRTSNLSPKGGIREAWEILCFACDQSLTQRQMPSAESRMPSPLQKFTAPTRLFLATLFVFLG